MRQRWIAIVALLLLAGCSGGSSPAQAPVPKEAFVRQLTELCAGVNQRLAGVKPDVQPGRVADQLSQLVKTVRSRPTPAEDREKLHELLAALADSSVEFRDAESARASGNESAASNAVKQATRRMDEADRAAVQYGMGHLADCDKKVNPAKYATPSRAPAQPVAWQVGKDVPIAVQQVASAVVDGVIWIVGGLTGTEATPAIESYDPATDTWKAGPVLPARLSHAMAVSYKGELVVLGGWQPMGNNLSAVTSDRVFFLRNGRWVEGPRLNRPRAAGAAAVVGDEIVVVGGRAGNDLVRPTEVFDGSRWRDAANIPVPGDHLAAASEASYLYAVGGRRLSADRNTAALQRYDPDTDRWRQLTPMPTARGGLGAAVVDGRLIAVGGEAPAAVHGAVEAYDIATSTWSVLPALKTARHGLAVAAVGQSLYAIGGAAKPSHAASTKTVEALAVPPRQAQPAVTWREGQAVPIAMQQAATAVVDGVIWVVGGLVGTEATSRIEGYDPAIDTWKAGPVLPVPLSHAMAVSYKGQLVVMGGLEAAGSNVSPVASSRVLFLRNGRWVDGPRLNRPRAAGAAAVVGAEIVVVGGEADERLVSTTEIFNGRRWRDAANIPSPGSYVAAASDGSHFYAVGGRRLSPDQNSAAVQRYDVGTDRWGELPRMRTARGSLGATIVDGRLVAVGGEDPTAVLGTVEAYDIATSIWSPLRSLKTARHGLAVAAVGNSLYVIGGATGPGIAASTRTVEILDFS